MMKRLILTLFALGLFVGVLADRGYAFHVKENFTVDFHVWGGWSPFFFPNISSKDLQITFIPKSGAPIVRNITLGGPVSIDRKIDIDRIIIKGQIYVPRWRIVPSIPEGYSIAEINKEITSGKFMQENDKTILNVPEKGAPHEVGANGKIILRFDDNKNLTKIDLGSWTPDLGRLHVRHE
ncbi:MAG: hypothetical protein COZ46_03150 [Verrucomicrobia bacterium CG_4_10_14_3_um_filter_43_23]|nr:MAG: hypothetical protein AUJ82_00575 [Verrucomicrobia bacterium CG1_02_43_26]PIP59234.1 MAG: hypothetical protein COX01_04360 [Verrucomicrobia bacterium CG22_combo_CG10-13_8_21_14_all_43_17]PIX58582.1 MAG: hypothetical protein COZ46_03150 [Verrucomicrobia bacterium CG_4_10_14_3_um_filter_43_23]PIY61034.1 MAG: hypothetical protein COY94_07470 [Verrucomicrobia bacterium CG_4_10_14_0_8_um_filter_43_34]